MQIYWQAYNPDFFEDLDEIIPTVLTIETKGDSLYASYEDFGIWSSQLPDVTKIEDDLDEISGKTDDPLSVFPNPLVMQSTVSYSLSNDAPVTLGVYDLNGIERTTLIDGFQTHCEYNYRLESGKLDNGLYFLILKVGDKQFHKTIVVM